MADTPPGSAQSVRSAVCSAHRRSCGHLPPAGSAPGPNGLLPAVPTLPAAAPSHTAAPISLRTGAWNNCLSAGPWLPKACSNAPHQSCAAACPGHPIAAPLPNASGSAARHPDAPNTHPCTAPCWLCSIPWTSIEKACADVYTQSEAHAPPLPNAAWAASASSSIPTCPTRPECSQGSPPSILEPHILPYNLPPNYPIASYTWFLSVAVEPQPDGCRSTLTSAFR